MLKQFVVVVGTFEAASVCMVTGVTRTSIIICRHEMSVRQKTAARNFN